LIFPTINNPTRRNELDYLGLRFWIGMWIAFILIVLVAIDASAIVCYITRFTEENFALLIATIFIYKVIFQSDGFLTHRIAR
jgi:sodium bicarbonate transporter 10